jgi:hypothetical protein
MLRFAEGVDEGMEKNTFEAVVIGHQETHAGSAPRKRPAGKGNPT